MNAFSYIGAHAPLLLAVRLPRMHASCTARQAFKCLLAQTHIQSVHVSVIVDLTRVDDAQASQPLLQAPGMV
jgi:hypothetical protein